MTKQNVFRLGVLRGRMLATSDDAEHCFAVEQIRNIITAEIVAAMGESSIFEASISIASECGDEYIGVEVFSVASEIIKTN